MTARGTEPAHDQAFMRAAIALARRGLGRTWPNPSVAALVIDEAAATPRVLGRGRTAPGGRPHAEALAVAAAGPAARGATMYVTLEPCAQRSQRVFGPSCTEIILESGIARVVIGAADPSPFAGGEGAQRLRDAGVEVVTGVLESEAREITAGHCLRVSGHRPHVTLKLAQTADGFAGTVAGGQLPITGEAARAMVHRMRSTVDCLITGIGTVLADDPRLDVRLPGMEAMSPLRVVLDTEGRMPATARMLLNSNASTLILTAKDRNQDVTYPSQHIEFTHIPSGEDHRLDIKAALASLAARGMTRALVEAGPRLAAAFAAADLVDELALFTSPHAVGEGLPALLPPLAGWRDRAQLVEERMIGADRFCLYRKA